MTKLIKVFICFISLASISSCGGGGGSSSNSDITETDNENSNWNEIIWDQGSWK